MLLAATLSITLALFWYSIAVWAERIGGRLLLWHVILFWLGFVFDATGTLIMTLMSKDYVLNIHGLTGPVALGLMLFHAAWASLVLYRKNEKRIRNFHKFSLFVWLIWLIPYFTGMALHMF